MIYRKVTANEIELEKRLGVAEQKALKCSADTDYLAMMVDVEIPEEDEGGEEDA